MPEVDRTPHRQQQKRNTLHHIVVKMLNILNKEGALKVREKDQHTYKGMTIGIRSNFSIKISKVRRAYRNIF